MAIGVLVQFDLGQAREDRHRLRADQLRQPRGAARLGHGIALEAFDLAQQKTGPRLLHAYRLQLGGQLLGLAAQGRVGYLTGKFGECLCVAGSMLFFG